MPPGQHIKVWSWQKPYIEEYLRKTCAHELKEVPTNPCKIDFTNIHTFSLPIVKSHALTLKHYSLTTHIRMAESYLANTQYNGIIVPIDTAGHGCSVTATNSRCYIFDYEAGPSSVLGPSASDDWSITDAITGVSNYLRSQSFDRFFNTDNI